jgi:hypothetical protein
MTPKEKAFHLHFSFIRDVIADNDKAKICALKVVDEIIKSKPSIAYKEGSEWMTPLTYWLTVYDEIEKL